MHESDYKQMVRKAFNEAAAGYDKPAMRFFDLSAEHLVKKLPLKGSELLLDAATGTGKIAVLAAKRLPNGKVMGIDLSDEMLAKAAARANQVKVQNIQFECKDITNVDLPPAHFDGLTCGFGVFFWADMEMTLTHLLASIRPGGFVAFTSFLDGAFLPLSKILLTRFEQYGVQLPKFYSWQRLDDPNKHRALLEKVGAIPVETEVAPMGYFLKDANEWWDIVYNTGFRSFYNQLSPEKAEQFKREHIQEIQLICAPNGIELNVPVIFTIGRV